LKPELLAKPAGFVSRHPMAFGRGAARPGSLAGDRPVDPGSPSKEPDIGPA